MKGIGYWRIFFSILNIENSLLTLFKPSTTRNLTIESNNKEENDICPKKEMICLSLLYLVLFG
jgi:hypothetical protein